MARVERAAKPVPLGAPETEVGIGGTRALSLRSRFACSGLKRGLFTARRVACVTAWPLCERRRAAPCTESRTMRAHFSNPSVVPPLRDALTHNVRPQPRTKAYRGACAKSQWTAQTRAVASARFFRLQRCALLRRSRGRCAAGGMNEGPNPTVASARRFGVRNPCISGLCLRRGQSRRSHRRPGSGRRRAGGEFHRHPMGRERGRAKATGPGENGRRRPI